MTSGAARQRAERAAFPALYDRAFDDGRSDAAWSITRAEVRALFRNLRVLSDRVEAADRERRARPTDEGGPGKEEGYWLKAKLNASIRHLRDVEDYYRVERGGTPTSPNMVRADRARSLYEQISDDFLNGKLNVPTMRERAVAAEERVDELEKALRRYENEAPTWMKDIARAALSSPASPNTEATDEDA